MRATSVSGTFETCRLHRAMSAFRGNPEEICSGWVLLSLTQRASIRAEYGCLGWQECVFARRTRFLTRVDRTIESF
jgi:hypothetical protein